MPSACTCIYFITVSSCLNGMVHLVGGPTPYAGRLEICNDEQWTTVCGDNFRTTSASVVCKQLFGENASKCIDSIKLCIKQIYSNAYLFIVGAVWNEYYYQLFGQGSSSSILDDLICTGSESSISQCSYTEVRDFSAAGCYHNRDVEMICYGI